MATIPHLFTRRFVWAGMLVGFALGGFFDGILLHQILQWHHLLSGVDAEAVRDLRVQVLADGVFHGLMYGIAAAGLWMLYRARRELTGARADRRLAGDLLVGFGAWHIADTLFSHWLTGIHRIRQDSPDPLFWDLVWLVLFGLVPLAIGLVMNRRYPRQAELDDRRAGAGRRRLALSVAALAVAAGAWAMLPPANVQGVETVTVVLRPDVRPGEFLAGLEASGARIVWNDRAGGVWVLTSAGSPWSYYRHGAIYVSGSVLPAGCAAWFKT